MVPNHDCSKRLYTCGTVVVLGKVRLIQRCVCGARHYLDDESGKLVRVEYCSACPRIIIADGSRNTTSTSAELSNDDTIVCDCGQENKVAV